MQKEAPAASVAHQDEVGHQFTGIELLQSESLCFLIKKLVMTTLSRVTHWKRIQVNSLELGLQSYDTKVLRDGPGMMNGSRLIVLPRIGYVQEVVPPGVTQKTLQVHINWWRVTASTQLHLIVVHMHISVFQNYVTEDYMAIYFLTYSLKAKCASSQTISMHIKSWALKHPWNLCLPHSHPSVCQR